VVFFYKSGILIIRGENLVDRKLNFRGSDMGRRKFSLAAQSTVEYIVAILVIVGILIVAGVYYQRSLQDKYRQSVDTLGGGEQY
jgi:hypothetical protein